MPNTTINMKRLIVTFFLYASVESFLQYYPQQKLHKKLKSRNGGDAGEPLYLTPYVESGNIEEARHLARVPFTEDFGIKSYSGLFTVNKKYFCNHFFWYFPPLNNKKEAPVLLWLQGGPGISSLYGLFTENGPLQVINGEKLEKRDITWVTNHHVIYIDNPAGTGFSFTNVTSCYINKDIDSGVQLYSTMIQFFKLFPELQANDFHISGESYAGKYVPALAAWTHLQNKEAELKINLKGIVMGNAWSDPIHQLVYGEYAYQLGLIDCNQMKVIEEHRIEVEKYIQKEDGASALSAWFDLMAALDMFTGSVSIYNHQTTKNTSKNSDDYELILQKTDVRKGLHVGELPFETSEKVYDYLKNDMMMSMVHWITDLLNHYHVVVYNGQLDIIVGYPLTVNYLRNLNFSAAEEYKTATRLVWKVDGDVAGYVKTAGNLTEILVRNAGHMVPSDQPTWAWDMITRITHGKGFLEAHDLTQY